MGYGPTKDDGFTTGLWCTAFKAQAFDLDAMADRKLGYQRLDQLISELLIGAR